jgi:drug/metabolite transporter (DMT)-like permease
VLGVLLLSLGIVAFMFEMEAHEVDATVQRAGVMGIALCLVSLLADGIVGTTQDQILRAHRPPPHLAMLVVNVWGLLFCAVPLWLSGELALGCQFVMKYPVVGMNL